MRANGNSGRNTFVSGSNNSCSPTIRTSHVAANRMHTKRNCWKLKAIPTLPSSQTAAATRTFPARLSQTARAFLSQTTNEVGRGQPDWIRHHLHRAKRRRVLLRHAVGYVAMQYLPATQDLQCHACGDEHDLQAFRPNCFPRGALLAL